MEIRKFIPHHFPMTFSCIEIVSSMTCCFFPSGVLCQPPVLIRCRLATMNRPSFLNTRNTSCYSRLKSGRSLIQVRYRKIKGLILNEAEILHISDSICIAANRIAVLLPLRSLARKGQTEHISCSSLDKQSTEASLAASAIQYLQAFHASACLKHWRVKQTDTRGVTSFPGLRDPSL